MELLMSLAVALIVAANQSHVPTELRIQALKTASIALEYARAQQNAPTPMQVYSIGVPQVVGHTRASCEGLTGAGDTWTTCVDSSTDSGQYGYNEY